MQLLLLSPIILLITYIVSKFNNNYRNKKTTYKVKKKTTKKASSGKPKDEIRFNYASGHYALVKDKKIVKENKKKVKRFVVISLSSKENDARKENIAMKKNPNPIKEKEKQQLLRYRKKNLITQEEYEQICRKGKLNSYFMKRVRSYNEDKFANDNLVETNNWKLHPEDREKADKLYNQYLENKAASKALEKTKKERANNT